MDIFTFQPFFLKKWSTLAALLFALAAPGPAQTLTCPVDQVLTAPPGICGAYLEFDSLDWSSPLPLMDTTFAPGPGYFFEIGTTPVLLSVTATNGTPMACTFDVTVESFSPGVFCKSLVFIHLQECEQELLYTDLLETPYPCPLDFSVDILNAQGASLGDVMDISMIGATKTAKITHEYTGNSCWGQIMVLGDSLPMTLTCPPDATVFCHENYGPELAGLPEIESCFNPDLLELTFTDQVFNSFCNGDEVAFSVERTWLATDTIGNQRSCSQTISALRVPLNVIEFPPNLNDVQAPALLCTDSLPTSVLADTSNTGIPLVNGVSPSTLACNLAVFYTDSIANPCGNHFEILRKWEVFDFCENEFLAHTQTILIKDETGPAFEIPDTIFVSTHAECGPESELPGFGDVAECSGYFTQIITPWDTLDTDGGTVEIPLVPGLFEATYTATDGCGNVTTKTSVIEVTNGLISHCPENQTITCDFYNENLKDALELGVVTVLEDFGYPEFFVNCDLTLTESVDLNVDECGKGYFVRNFGIEEAQGGCSQMITVHHVSDFTVEFPKDTTVICGNTAVDFGEPRITGGSCENLLVEHTDEVFTVVADACYKILRTWVVANTCVTGDTTDQEVAEVSEAEFAALFPDSCDFDGDGDCDSLTFRDSWTLDEQPGMGHATQTTGPDTDPDGNPWDGYLVFQQTIKVTDTVDPVIVSCEIPEVCLTGPDCLTDVAIPDPVVDECDTYEVIKQVRVGGVWLSDFDTLYNLAAGTYDARYTVNDNCFNQSVCETTLTVKDCEAPVANCKDGLVIELAPGTQPSVTLYASDFDEDSEDNCSNQLEFSFSPNVNDIARVYDCDSIGLRNIQLWVTDAAGNQDFCETTVVIQPPAFPADICDDGSPQVSGNISTETGQGIANVEVSFSSGGVDITDQNGNFSLSGFSPGTVTPYRNDDLDNGVTTLDAVLITRHILGAQLLDSPYKIIAADVNKNNAVATSDLVEHRRMILGIYTELPNNTSWRFIPADFVFPNPANPFASPFPEVVTTGTPPVTGVDFIGLKVGDVNNSASVNFAGPSDERDGMGSLPFFIQPFENEANTIFEVSVFAPQMSMHGFQIALAFDQKKLELLDVNPGFVGKESFGKNHLADGILKVSWAAEKPFTASSGQAAFTLVFRSKGKIDLPSQLRIDPAAMLAEGYSGNLDILRPVLVFDEKNFGENKFRLLGLHPNPFRESAQVSFFLPEAGPVTLTLFDPAGRQFFQTLKHFEKGKNELQISGSDLPTEGLIFYHLQSTAGKAEGKIVKF